jgi:hypothetical protein
MPEISDLLEPISGSNPGGVSIRYTPVFDQIKQARLVEDELPANLLELLKRLDEISEGKKSNPDILAQAHQSLKTGAAIGAYAKGAMGGTSRDHANESLAASRSEDDRQQDHRKSD